MTRVNPGIALPLPQQIKETIAARIISGRLKADEKLPSETNLARASGVSRTTARQALLELIAEGILYRMPGKGTFVSGDNRPGKTSLLSAGRQIALIVPNLTNPFYHQILQGIVQAAGESRFETIVFSAGGDPVQERSLLEKFASGRKQGLILTAEKYSAGNLEILRKINRRFPLVVVDVSVPGLKSDLVVSDNCRGGFLITEHLLELGHSRILHLAGPKGDSSAEERLAGYLQALEKFRLKRRPELVRFTNWQAEDGYYETKKFFLNKNSPGADAIFACNDGVAFGAFRALSEVGFAVPEQVALAGFGNFTISQFLETPLTTVDQAAMEMGRIAARLLFEKITGRRKPDATSRKTVPTRLVIRQSCGIRQQNGKPEPGENKK